MNTPINVSWSKHQKTENNPSAGRLASRALEGLATDHCLNSNAMLHFDGNMKHMKFRILVGKVWLTQSNDPEDYLLFSGEEFMINRSGRIVLQALEDSIIRVIPAA